MIHLNVAHLVGSYGYYYYSKSCIIMQFYLQWLQPLNPNEPEKNASY